MTPTTFTAFIANHGGIMMLVHAVLVAIVAALLIVAWGIYQQGRASMRRLFAMQTARTELIADAERDAGDLKTMVGTLLTNQSQLAETVARRALETAGAVKASLDDVKTMVATMLNNQSQMAGTFTQHAFETAGAVKGSLDDVKTMVATLLTNQSQYAETLAPATWETAGAVKGSLGDIKTDLDEHTELTRDTLAAKKPEARGDS